MPDYALPDALCVPFWRFEIRAMLEAVARAASRRTGVVLIAPDPADAVSFRDTLPDPDHLAVVAGIFDTPWLRDHSPLAFEEGGRRALLRPRRPGEDRARDMALFAEILAVPAPETDLNIARGNLVAGPDGLAVSTFDVLRENPGEEEAAFRDEARLAGITHWLLLPPFPDDRSRHADTMVRFLAPDLAAIARRPGHPEADRAAVWAAEALAALRPDLRIVEIAADDSGEGWDSPLNWIQLDRALLVPDYDGLPGNLDRVRAALEPDGFEIVPIPSSTAGLGGGPHCLTASIYG